MRIADIHVGGNEKVSISKRTSLSDVDGPDVTWVTLTLESGKSFTMSDQQVETMIAVLGSTIR